MKPYYVNDQGVTLYHGDCIEIMRSLPDSSVHAVVTDPPYGLGFMGKAWDDLPPGLDFAAEALRVLKPGGHILAFGGTRTWHRLAVAMEDAGFEIRDSIAWHFGSGMPKSLNVSKAIDKANGRNFEDRYALGRHIRTKREAAGVKRTEVNAWFGYRDGCEHWERQDAGGARVPTVADFAILRERLSLSTEWDALVERAEAERPQLGLVKGAGAKDPNSFANGHNSTYMATAPALPAAQQWDGWGTALKPAFEPILMARKPLVGTTAANVLLHGVGAINIDAARIGSRWPANVAMDQSIAETLAESRFFYVAKAGKNDRPSVDGVTHPTVKPLELMRWLVRLVTPTGGTVLDPFAGSGTTIEAALLEGFKSISIEREDAYLPLIMQRIKKPLWQPLPGGGIA